MAAIVYVLGSTASLNRSVPHIVGNGNGLCRLNAPKEHNTKYDKCNTILRELLSRWSPAN